jgi:hypothetical protein
MGRSYLAKLLVALELIPLKFNGSPQRHTDVLASFRQWSLFQLQTRPAVICGKTEQEQKHRDPDVLRGKFPVHFCFSL